MAAIDISIILSTYNQPAWLEKSLWGYAAQSALDFELVIADDGSDERTRHLLEKLQPNLPFPLQHVWHEDRGFQKCEILNKAIQASRGSYLIFSDGDCIPRADFVAQHLRHREPKRFLSGGYFKLPRNISHSIGFEDIRLGRFADASWLLRNGLTWSYKLTKLVAKGIAARCLDRLSPARASWNGHNASGWKADIVAVNGFDERMQYGGEDRELGERLENAGVKGKRIRHQAVCVHLDHDRGYVKPEMILNNRRIRANTKKNNAVWTDYGIKREP